jgi:hypothetical protein
MLRTEPEHQDFTIEMARDFHRRMAGAVEAVQTGIWAAGAHELLGYATDFGFGQARGVQTLVLKTRRRSVYLRFSLDSILGNSAEDLRAFDEAIRGAIIELG